ncbi:hypothetical protein KSP40_PGU013617 [Platanthera guangdongensis]|uniref:WD repeat-containing protein 25 n=1 Tax=Platanthera guangdongensis TaxID=2320717 RepID=A0ABR2LQX1_9ASPA
MDLLQETYAKSSDEEDKENVARSIICAKRRRSEGHSFHGLRSPPMSSHSCLSVGEPDQAPLVAGRYISKRERRMLLTSSTKPLDFRPSVIMSSDDGSLSDTDIPVDIKLQLKGQCKTYAHGNNISGNLVHTLMGHSKAINSIQWSHNYAHLLASAGMDQSVIIWNVWTKSQKKVCTFSHHKAAVKDVRWCPKGLFLLSCGYDYSSRLLDVEKGVETHLFMEDQVVESIRFHPTDSNLFLSGGSKGIIRLWDTRVKKVIHEYLRHLGPVLDVEFSVDGKHFISSTDTSRSNISENAIIVWDVSRQIPLSNQVYTEAFTCPCIRYHPSNTCFVAQSNGNYIAIFSAKPPFRLDVYKRFENHGVWGYPIKCNFNSDGEELASGSSDGSIYFYDYKSTKLSRKIKVFEEPCIDVAFHPSIPSVVASCSWSGEISVFD